MDIVDLVLLANSFGRPYAVLHYIFLQSLALDDFGISIPLSEMILEPEDTSPKAEKVSGP